jgi:hypothetical protein
MDEFEHYFRICLPRQITSEEARKFLFAVDDVARANPDENDVVMVYHEGESGAHCYDVRLLKDATGEQGDEILSKLESIFPDDDFELESSMDMVSEHRILNTVVLEQLSKKL